MCYVNAPILYQCDVICVVFIHWWCNHPDGLGFDQVSEQKYSAIKLIVTAWNEVTSLHSWCISTYARVFFA